jgi:hypothetical protein
MVDAANFRWLVMNTMVSCLSSSQTSIRRSRMGSADSLSLAKMTTSSCRTLVPSTAVRVSAMM